MGRRSPDFDAETAVREVEPGRFEATIDPAWQVARGPNGGYVAAIMLRALAETVGDPSRRARSLTIHYTAPASDGPIEITTATERTGRSLTSCSGRITQGDTLVAIAIGAFSSSRQGPRFCDLVMPDVLTPDMVEPLAVPDDAPPIARRWETLPVLGGMPYPGMEPTKEAVGGGWIRLPERRVADEVVIAAMTDAWLPPVFARLGEPVVVPTVDLTIHFRSVLPHPDAQADDFVFVRFRTTVAAEGFLEEDGEVWSPDGVLLAQSRQLAAIMPMPEPDD